MKALNRVVEWAKDPFGIQEVVNSINVHASLIQGDIYHSTKRTEELSKFLDGYEARMEDHLFLKQVNDALDGSVPDMFWVKDLDGKYIMANKAIREKLLFDDDPIGKTDRELADAIIAEVGADNHTFGAICGNSDLEVVDNNKRQKFNEDGLVKGEYMMLQVYKNVVRNSRGEVIATVGVGRDMTRCITGLTDIANNHATPEVGKMIMDVVNFYKFEDRS